MKPSGWQIGILTAAALLVLAASGCTGTDILITGNSRIQVAAEVAGLEQSSIPWTCILFEFDEMSIRPLDGTCDESSPDPLKGTPCLDNSDCRRSGVQGTCVGSSAQELLPSDGVIAIDSNETERGNLLGGPCENSYDLGGSNNNLLNAGEFVPSAPVVLTEGLYEITDMTLLNIVLFRNGETSYDLWKCDEFLFPLEYYPGETLRFKVLPGQDKVVLFQLDVDVLEDFWTLNASCFDIEENPVDIIPCVTCDGGIAP